MTDIEQQRAVKPRDTAVADAPRTPGQQFAALYGEDESAAPAIADRPEAPAYYIGPRKLAVWPEGQGIQRIGAGIHAVQFADCDQYHSILIDRILEEEAVLRRESPPNTRCLGGQKIRRSTIESWRCPAFELLNARAKSFFRQVLGCDEAVADAWWVNVYRQWESIGPHSHRRATAGVLYCIDPGDKDPFCEMSGKFAFIDPRLDICCQIEEGHMTTPYYPEITAGTMVVFPGRLVHHVAAYAGERPRITMVWNINTAELPGKVGDLFDESDYGA